MRVDLARAFCVGQVADRRDALATHANIGLARLRATAVIDRSMANDDVVFRRGRLDLAGGEAQNQNRRYKKGGDRKRSNTAHGFEFPKVIRSEGEDCAIGVRESKRGAWS